MIITITSEKSNGKGKEELITYDVKYYIHELLNKQTLSKIDFSKYSILICDFNEDAIRATGSAKRHFRTLDNMLNFYMEICSKALEVNPSIQIYQNPSKCSWIGNKEKTNSILKTMMQESDIFALPKSTTIQSINDICNIESYPVIMKVPINSGKERKLDCVVYTVKEAKQKYSELFKNYKEIIAIEYINSRIPSLKCNHMLRLFIFNDLIVDWSIRPSSAWNIHASNSIVSKIDSAENYIEPIIKRNMYSILTFIKKIYDKVGKGFFAWDVIYSEKRNKFYICELGLKYFDHFMANKVKGRISKLCMNKDKLKIFYTEYLQ